MLKAALQHPSTSLTKIERKSMNGASRQLKSNRGAFDYFVLAGAAVNIVVVTLLFGYWLLH